MQTPTCKNVDIPALLVRHRESNSICRTKCLIEGWRGYVTVLATTIKLMARLKKRKLFCDVTLHCCFQHMGKCKKWPPSVTIRIKIESAYECNSLSSIIGGFTSSKLVSYPVSISAETVMDDMDASFFLNLPYKKVGSIYI